MGNEKALIGKTLKAVQVAKDRGAIRFVLDDGEIVARCDGDCCSHTWIEHVELPELPATVTAAENIDMPEGAASLYEKSTDVVTYYGLKLSTSKGALLIDYRNDSNGYYGGNLSWPGGYFYGGVHGQNESAAEWEASNASQPKAATKSESEASDV